MDCLRAIQEKIIFGIIDMNMHYQEGFLVPVRWLILCASLVFSQVLMAETSGKETYADLAPLLAQRCVMCHSGEFAPLGLRLDSLESLLKGSSRGSVVKAGDPANSELIRRIKGVSQPRMPMTGPPFLSDKEIAQFEYWVAAGLPKGDITSVAKPNQTAVVAPAAGEPVTYRHVAPIFATRCAKCHAAQGLMGGAPEGYQLTSYEETLSTNGRVRVVPGKPESSELIRRIRGQAQPRMPFDGPPYLSEGEIKLIQDWVAQGAKNAEGKIAPNPIGANVRLRGRLSAQWQLDDTSLIVDGGTRIDKSPSAGDYVEVRGHLDEALNIQVDRIKRR